MCMRSYIILLLTLMIINISCAGAERVRSILPRNSFLKMEKSLLLTVCNPKNPNQCLERLYGATASGVVIENTDSGSYALTAAHVCSDKRLEVIKRKVTRYKMSFNVLDIDAEKFSAEVIASDPIHDVCIIFIKGLQRPPIRLAATKPKPGDRVYNVAAPIGIFGKQMVPIFEGFYNGEAHNRALFSLPVKGGSSGSPITNRHGELVGMVSAAFVHFGHLAISPTYEALTSFIKTIVAADKLNRPKLTILSKLMVLNRLKNKKKP